MENTILSVIVPVYNEEKYLKECLNSIINQTYSNLDIILVDDGSEDCSGDICEEYAILDKRISVIHQPNNGMINARYTGVKCAKGDYIIFCDADDFVDKNAYEYLMNTALGHSADVVTSGCYRYYSEEYTVKDVCARVEEGFYSKELIREKIIPIMLWQENYNTWGIDPSLCSKVIKKDVLIQQYTKLKEYNFSFGEDSSVLFPSLLEIEKLYISHKCFYFHRQRMREHPAGYIQDRYFPDQLLKLYNYLYSVFERDENFQGLKMQLDMFFAKSSQFIKQRYPNIQAKQDKRKFWMFPFYKILQGSSIVLYGAGKVGQCFWNQLQTQDYCTDILWVDKKPSKDNPNVHSIHEIQADKYNYLVIAIESYEICEQVKSLFMNNGWNEEQIIISEFERQCIYV